MTYVWHKHTQAHLLALLCVYLRVANQDFAFVFLFSIVCLFPTNVDVFYIHIRSGQCALMCECVYFRFLLMVVSEQLRRVANMTEDRNDDVCKGNFDELRKKRTTNDVKCKIETEQ